jgi:hypothetical protein
MTFDGLLAGPALFDYCVLKPPLLLGLPPLIEV